MFREKVIGYVQARYKFYEHVLGIMKTSGELWMETFDSVTYIVKNIHIYVLQFLAILIYQSLTKTSSILLGSEGRRVM